MICELCGKEADEFGAVVCIACIPEAEHNFRVFDCGIYGYKMWSDLSRAEKERQLREAGVCDAATAQEFACQNGLTSYEADLLISDYPTARWPRTSS
jgi:predicted amidophosphoribosyltransferase